MHHWLRGTNKPVKINRFHKFNDNVTHEQMIS